MSRVAKVPRAPSQSGLSPSKSEQIGESSLGTKDLRSFLKSKGLLEGALSSESPSLKRSIIQLKGADASKHLNEQRQKKKVKKTDPVVDVKHWKGKGKEKQDVINSHATQQEVIDLMSSEEDSEIEVLDFILPKTDKASTSNRKRSTPPSKCPLTIPPISPPPSEVLPTDVILDTQISLLETLQDRAGMARRSSSIESPSISNMGAPALPNKADLGPSGQSITDDSNARNQAGIEEDLQKPMEEEHDHSDWAEESYPREFEGGFEEEDEDEEPPYEEYEFGPYEQHEEAEEESDPDDCMVVQEEANDEQSEEQTKAFGILPKLSKLFHRGSTYTKSEKKDESTKTTSKAAATLPYAQVNGVKTSATSTPSRAHRPLSNLPNFSSNSTIGTKLELEENKDVKGPNAFTALMTTTSEVKQWRAADTLDPTRGKMPKGVKRGVPFYKWVEGMEITVDAFRYGKIYGCRGYFLSHAHSDHYQNLSSSWTHGPIYCSVTTANLIKLKLKVADEWVHALPMDETIQIPGMQLKVTLIDANHCPGSVVFLFEGPHTDSKSVYSKQPSRVFRHLHCGDFRASPAHINHPSMVGKKIDICYLDTTYLDSKYCFPAQELVIDACSQLVRARVVEGDEMALSRVGGDQQNKQERLMKGWLDTAPKVENGLKSDEGDQEDMKPKLTERLLVLVGTYSIGKERIVKGLARALDTKIYCDTYKRAIFDAQDDPELHSMLSDDPLEAQVHIVNLRDINRDFHHDYLNKYKVGKISNGFSKVIGLRPTGWTYRPENKGEKTPTIAKILEREKLRTFSAAGMYPQRDSTSMLLAFGVPYSEHSSFFELTCFALSLNYTRMIPTVNIATESSRAKQEFWFKKWKEEQKRRADARIPRMVPPRSATHW